MILNQFFTPKKTIALTSVDTFFMTYDEPYKDRSWFAVKKKLANITRVDGVKGFDKVHKLCASLCAADRFVTIDGDNEILPDFHSTMIDHSLYQSDYIISWSSINSVNGLAYGNGGVKCWPTKVVHQMNSHESSQQISGAIDFCYDLEYFQRSEVLSMSTIHHTPYQAFRAGFREGVKMGLIKGLKLTSKDLKRQLHNLISKSNLERLRIWCTVGKDVNNGLWAIYGARLGFYSLYGQNKPLELVRDYDWFNSSWTSSIFNKFAIEETNPYHHFRYDYDKLEQEVRQLGEHLNSNYELGLCDYNPQQSSFFKSNYRNITREGLMIS